MLALPCSNLAEKVCRSFIDKQKIRGLVTEKLLSIAIFILMVTGPLEYSLQETDLSVLLASLDWMVEMYRFL